MSPLPFVPDAHPRVLVICTGNVCRSPYAEHLLRDLVPDLVVSSRGTFALDGHPVDAEMATLLTTRDIDCSAFHAQQLKTEDVSADLILTMSARQRSTLIEEHPEAARRVGLLGAMAELELSVRDHGGELSAEAIAAWSRRPMPAGRDIPDPYRRGPEAASTAAALIEREVERLVPLLTHWKKPYDAPIPR